MVLRPETRVVSGFCEVSVVSGVCGVSWREDPEDPEDREARGTLDRYTLTVGSWASQKRHGMSAALLTPTRGPTSIRGWFSA